MNNFKRVPHIPLNIGASLHTPRPPIDVNCPREHSSKNNGTPAKIRVRKYGIRNAPKKAKTEVNFSSVRVSFCTIYSRREEAVFYIYI